MQPSVLYFGLPPLGNSVFPRFFFLLSCVVCSKNRVSPVPFPPLFLIFKKKKNVSILWECKTTATRHRYDLFYFRS